MKYFSVLFDFKTRPMFRKGRWKTAHCVVAANDLAEALRLAKAEGGKRYFGRKWHIIVCSELTVSGSGALQPSVSEVIS